MSDDARMTYEQFADALADFDRFGGITDASPHRPVVREALRRAAAPSPDVVGEIVAWLREMGRERVLITNEPKLRNPLKLADQIYRRFGGGESGWRPIESAPKNGRFWGYCKTTGEAAEAWFDDEFHFRHEHEAYEREHELYSYPLTHWRPLPPPPEDKP